MLSAQGLANAVLALGMEMPHVGLQPPHHDPKAAGLCSLAPILLQNGGTGGRGITHTAQPWNIFISAPGSVGPGPCVGSARPLLQDGWALGQCRLSEANGSWGCRAVPAPGAGLPRAAGLKDKKRGWASAPEWRGC